ncbi:hypothetical protein [Streptomyces adelaidensis]|uniref:hypothetical protein n=1 Tax=Streptomyces adelaidensis TaxID=2796465 RepID=UPI0019043D2E|nr:hypothetical protein [Streptomyces adelaidensis]
MTSKLTDRNKRRIAAVGMACVATLGAAAITAPNASAEANRRICFYGDAVATYNATGHATGYYFWVMNYKKDGGCPANPSQRSKDEGAKSAYTAKWTCEDFATKMRYINDPCTGTMIKDKIYKVALVGQNTASPYVTFDQYN